MAKLSDKKSKLSNQLKKLQEAAAKPDYVTKVPENVRTQNAEKVYGILVAFEKLGFNTSVYLSSLYMIPEVDILLGIHRFIVANQKSNFFVLHS